MKVEIAEYNPGWKNIFENEKKFLSNLLKEFSPAIEHIGSTAVEGLCAKPTVDIQIGVSEYKHLNLLIEKMIESGYVYYKKYEDVLPDRRYFVKTANLHKAILPKILFTYEENFDRKEHLHLFHIHAVELNSDWWKRHIAFRDYLRTHTDTKDEYDKLKRSLSEKDWEDKNDYTDAKTEFVQSIEKLAGIKISS